MEEHLPKQANPLNQGISYSREEIDTMMEKAAQYRAKKEQEETEKTKQPTVKTRPARIRIFNFSRW